MKRKPGWEHKKRTKRTSHQNRLSKRQVWSCASFQAVTLEFSRGTGRRPETRDRTQRSGDTGDSGPLLTVSDPFTQTVRAQGWADPMTEQGWGRVCRSVGNSGERHGKGKSIEDMTSRLLPRKVENERSVEDRKRGQKFRAAGNKGKVEKGTGSRHAE